MTSTMGRFKNVGLVWRRKRIVMSQRPCGGALKGNFINSTMTKKMQRDGNSSGRCHHASRCTQLKPSVGCSVSWQVLKYLRSAGGVHAGLPVTQRKVPFCGTPGVGETPRSALRRARLQLFFELCRGMVCLLAARMSTLWWGSAPFVCGQKEAVIQPERGDLYRSSLFKPTLLTHNVIHHLDLTPWMQMRFKRTLLCIRQLSHTTQWLGDGGPSLSISAPYPTALSFGGSGEIISKVMMLIRTKRPVALQPQVFGTLQRMSQVKRG